MLDKEQLNLLQKYVDNELSAEEQVRFENHLTNNTEFAKEANLEQQINEFLQHPVTQARRIVAVRREELFAKSIEPSSYTLSELLQMFAPAPELEESITTRSVATAMPHSLQTIIALPENGIDCHDVLFFDLDEPVASPLRCEIFNNQSMPVVGQEIPANEASFDITFSLPPGRYYWELKPTDRQVRRQLGSAQGMFLIDERLMPPVPTK